jgi:hypothetical protein
MLYALPARALGAPPEVCGAAWMIGAQLGALPDALPWVVGRITGRGDIEQWLRILLHDPPEQVEYWMKAFAVPWLHVLLDRFIHAPTLPDPGTSAFHDRILVRIRTWTFTVRDLLWCLGELALWLAVYVMVELYRSI